MLCKKFTHALQGRAGGDEVIEHNDVRFFWQDIESERCINALSIVAKGDILIKGDVQTFGYLFAYQRGEIMLFMPSFGRSADAPAADGEA